MKVAARIAILLILLLSMPLFSVSLSFSQEILDTTSTKVQIPERPQRIITLAPSLGELAADLIGNETERLIGVSEYSDYPPYLKKISSIGPFQKVNLEKIISLKPDLILATRDGNSQEQVNHLRELKMPVVVVNTETLLGIEDSIRLVAQSVGSLAQGNQMIQQLKTGMERIRNRCQMKPHLRTVLQLGDHPMVVAGGNSYLNELLELVGARNVYGDLKAHYPRPSIEDLVRKNPEVILVAAMGSTEEETHSLLEAVAQWRQYPTVRAVQTQRIYVLKTDTLLRPTLRLLEGLSMLEKTLYETK